MMIVDIILRSVNLFQDGWLGSYDALGREKEVILLVNERISPFATVYI